MTPGGVENLVCAAVLFALIGLGLFAFVRWATRDTSHMTPEEAVSHREKVITVDKGLAVTNVALTVLNQGIKHAETGPARKTTASDVVVPAIGLAGYALSRHAERQKRHRRRGQPRPTAEPVARGAGGSRNRTAGGGGIPVTSR